MNQEILLSISIQIKNTLQRLNGGAKDLDIFINDFNSWLLKIPNQVEGSNMSQLVNIISEDIISISGFYLSKPQYYEIFQALLNKILAINNTEHSRKIIFEQIIEIQTRKNNPYWLESNIDELINRFNSTVEKLYWEYYSENLKNDRNKNVNNILPSMSYAHHKAINQAIQVVFTDNIIHQISSIDVGVYKSKLINAIAKHPESYSIEKDIIEKLKPIAGDDRTLLSKLNEIKYQVPINTHSVINVYDNIYKNLSKKISPDWLEIIFPLIFLTILIAVLLYIFK